MILQGVETSKVWTYTRQNGFIDKDPATLLNGKWENASQQKVLTINKDRFDLSIEGEIVESGPFVIWNTGNYLLFGEYQAETIMTHLDYYKLIIKNAKGGSQYAGTYKHIG